MKRQIFAVAAAAATALAVLPAVPALAAANATTALADPNASVVYPGAQEVRLTVTNNEPPATLGLGGKVIDAIRVTFPVDQAGITLGASPGNAGAGFTDAKSTNLGSTQFTIFRKGSGNGLAPGATTTITLPVTVNAPTAKDLSGAFRVAVSSDNFATSSGAVGDLGMKVKVLEIIQNSLKPTGPAGVLDRSGTGAGNGFGGQTVTYETQVKNHALSELPVDVALTSSGADTAPAVPVSIKSGETKTVNFNLKLGAAPTDRTATLTASATKGTDAAAPVRTDAFTVQTPVTLPLSELTPSRWRTGDNSARDFATKAVKAGTPGVTALSGEMAWNTGTALENKCPVKGSPSFPKNAADGTITFACPDLKGSTGFSTVKPAVTGSLTDDNGASYAFGNTLGDLLLDNVAPILTDVRTVLPKDRDGMQQIAVKQSGDVVTVTGVVANAGDLASSDVAVTLTPDTGAAQTFNAPISGDTETRTFSGTYTLKDWGTSAKTFTTKVAVVDTVGNLGEGDGANVVGIDRTTAELKNPARIVDTTTIEVQFTDDNQVAGGCTPSLYLIDGRPNRVTQVRTGDGVACDQLGTGVRLLTISPALGPDDTPTVTYDPTGARQAETLGQKLFPVKDGAGIDTIRQVVNTITDIIPATPDIIRLERRDGDLTAGFERAYLDTDESTYYTNVPGDGALRLTVNQVRSGYQVEVKRNDGKTTTVSPAAPLGTVNGASYEATVLVPVADTAALQTFEVRLISTQGRASQPNTFKLVLDKIAPALGTATSVIDGSVVTVTAGLSEKIVAGSDFADNWLACETVKRENGTDGESCVPPDSVTGGSMTARTLTVRTFERPDAFKRVAYVVNSGNRYEDRAGNLMADAF